jgi:3'-phosphoadenosine 5'-phosphosulfate sulfotransferase (PAPS reductase)/FAD synthetase
LKVDVCDLAIRNQPRFCGKRTLVVSGERAQESEARAAYKPFEADRTNVQKRLVDRSRPVHGWKETEVWAILERWSVNPHPAYRLAWGRLSCALCIFGGRNQWASAKAVLPAQFERVANYEVEFGKTIDRGGESVRSKAAKGVAHAQTQDQALVAEAMDSNWNGAIRVSSWQLPAGAFKGETCGPK